MHYIIRYAYCTGFDPFRYFGVAENEIEKSKQEALFVKILNESAAFHFWNSLTAALVPEPESLVERLLNHNCIRCHDVL